MIKKIVLLFLILSLNCISVSAYELDASVDEEIRKNYNPSALEQKLPELPKVLPETSVPPKSLPVQKPAKFQPMVKNFPSNNSKADKYTAMRIKKGTKFKVKSNAYLSDVSGQGARFSLVTMQPVNQRYFTVPVGTVFKASVVNSHRPQATGNGGLLEIMVDSVVYNGNTYYARAKVTKFNHKKVFVNNIKGKRGYWNGFAKQVNKGENFYKKTRRASSRLADNPIGIIISPIPILTGIGVYAVNLVGSPVIALFSKGGRVTVPAGTIFEIKLLEDVYLN